MAKPRTRYVAGIIWKGETPNRDEYDLESLKGVLYEEVRAHFEICKDKVKNSAVKGKAVIFELTNIRASPY
jgi:hypothetical protein